MNVVDDEGFLPHLFTNTETLSELGFTLPEGNLSLYEVDADWLYAGATVMGMEGDFGIIQKVEDGDNESNPMLQIAWFNSGIEYRSLSQCAFIYLTAGSELTIRSHIRKAGIEAAARMGRCQ
jgi:hypothetical protein